MSNRLVTRREFVLLWFVAVSIVLGSVVTIWMEHRGRAPVNKERAVASASAAVRPASSEVSIPIPAVAPSGAQMSPSIEVRPLNSAGGGEIVVEVAGNVRRPGVYRFDRGATVADAIERAGGLSEDGDTSCLNRAAALLPATKLVVPGKRSAVRVDGRVSMTIPGAVDNIPQYRADSIAAGTVSAHHKPSAVVNINTASADQLETLPGIGPKIAQSIIEHRRSHPFVRIEDIMEVPRIGPKTFAHLRPLITVDGSR